MSLAKALLAFQTDAPALQKNAINPHFRNRYISLDSLMEQVLPLLNKHGIALLQCPTVSEAGLPALRTKLVHAESGDAVEDTMLLEVAKHDPQGQGSAITYARRYSLMAMLGLVADEDDDGNSSSKTGGSSPSPQAAQPAAGAASSHPQAGSAAPAFKAPEDVLGLQESRADRVQPDDGGEPGAVLLTFGKHKGKRVRDAPEAYLEWWLKQEPPGSPELRRQRAAVEMFLGRTPAGQLEDPDVPF